MDLPFSPTFFRKMEVFQQLMEYEDQVDKELWIGEKVFLVWAGSKLHQHLGSPVDGNHLKDAFNLSVEKNFIKNSERASVVDNPAYIAGNLVTHEFATLFDDSNPKNPRIKINRDGILAGQILIETKNLKNITMYRKWSWDWWFLYYAAGILLTLSLANSAIPLINLFLKRLGILL